MDVKAESLPGRNTREFVCDWPKTCRPQFSYELKDHNPEDSIDIEVTDAAECGNNAPAGSSLFSEAFLTDNQGDQAARTVLITRQPASVFCVSFTCVNHRDPCANIDVRATMRCVTDTSTVANSTTGTAAVNTSTSSAVAIKSTPSSEAVVSPGNINQYSFAIVLALIATLVVNIF
jgi:hypothetical protein